MADPQQTNSSIFPGPPRFYKSFSPENLVQFKALKDRGDCEDRLVPESLQFLIPPLAPTSGGYQSFGGRYEIDEKPVTLEEQGIDRLFPAAPSESKGVVQSQWTLNRAFELKKISKSLLLNFLELVGTLSVNPEQYGKKLEDIRTLFINAHHLLNEYRPHQARETLILMMEQQLEKTKMEIEGVRAMREKVEETLQKLGMRGSTAVTNGFSHEDPIRSDAFESISQKKWAILTNEFDS
ncbi:MAG: Mediator of RNA polymerase II transcription subunit 7 [Vezdaea aestivalis]|nr:MAG: Mediator of RNA polymerase II transcription subunit 7 [Vezdaea aestivalis]